MQLPAWGPPLEEGHLRLREGVLDDHDRQAGLGRGVHHAQDVIEVGVRVGDRQLAPGEVFVLDVDDQQGSLHDDSRSSVMACRQVEAGFAPHEHGEAAGRFIRPRIGNLRRRSDRIPDGFTRRGRSCPDQRFGAGKRQGPGPPGLPHRRSSAGPEPSRPRPPSTMQPWRANPPRRDRRAGADDTILCGKMAGAGRLISSFPAGGVPSTLPGKPATDSIDRRWESDAKRHDTSREEPFDEGARPWPSLRLPGRAPSGRRGRANQRDCPAPGRRRWGSRRSA